MNIDGIKIHDIAAKLGISKNEGEQVHSFAGRVVEAFKIKVQQKEGEYQEAEKQSASATEELEIAAKCHSLAIKSFESLNVDHKLLGKIGFKTGQYKVAEEWVVASKARYDTAYDKSSSAISDAMGSQAEYTILKQDLETVLHYAKLLSDKEPAKTIKVSLPSLTSNSPTTLEARIPTSKPEPSPQEKLARVTTVPENQPATPSTPQTSYQSFLAKYSESIFGLMNLGSANVDISDSPKNMRWTMFFTISVLEGMLKDHLIPEDEIKKTEQLLNNYRLGYEIAQMYEKLQNISNPEDLMAQKTLLQKHILSKLQEHNEVFIPTGYAASPYGHAIGLQLKIVDKDGIPHVQGEVINRGEGLEYHGKAALYPGLKGQFASILTLSSVPLTELAQSQFLNCLTELNIWEKSFRKNPLTGDEFSESTQFRISDFYEVALAEWPGQIQQAGQLQETRGAQRGPTCTMKACLTPMAQTLSSATADLIKLRMRIKSLELLLKYVPLEQCRISHLEWSIAKLNHSLEKLIEKGIATDREKKDCSELSKRMEQKIELLKKEAALKRGSPQSFTIDLINKTDYSVSIQSAPKLVEREDPSIQDSFEAGEVALSSKMETHPEGLPGFVTASGNYLFTNLNPNVKKTNENTYEFIEGGVPTKIVVSGNEFQTHQLLDRGDGTKGWFVYTSSSFPPVEGVGVNHPCGGYFLKETRLWTSVDSPPQAILTSQKDNHLICQISGNKIINVQEPGLELANIYESQNPLFKNFFALDDKQNILAWKTNDGSVKAFDFPTYNNLRLELKDGKWMSSQHEGFYVDTQAVIMELEPHPHYLVLKNDEGNRLVIMPNREVEHAPTDFRQKEAKAKAAEQPTLLEFSVNTSGGLAIPDDPSKLLYLTHLAFRSLDYQLARKLIKKLSLHPSQWTEKEQALYQWMELPEKIQQSPEMKSRYTDKHPYACALRCKMRLVALKSEAKNINLNELRSDYFACLEQINSLGSEWLTEEEEKEILQHLKGLATHPILATRENELNAIANQNEIHYFIHQEAAKKSAIPFPTLLKDVKLQREMAEVDKPRSIALSLRPGADIVFNFTYYYKIAYEKAPADKLEELKTLLRLSRNAPEATHRYLHAVLSDMLNPSSKVKWLHPFALKAKLRNGKLEEFFAYPLKLANINPNDLSPLIPQTTPFQEKLVLSADFKKHLTPKKPVRLKRASAVREGGPTKIE